ncbi:MAG: translation initiation factor [Cyclobacteriaceae bacterium]|nr:translation initiation factor [Cyclobacteriaceae bacterium]
MPKKNKWKGREGVVFSTGDGYDYSYEDEGAVETLASGDQLLYVELDKKARGGKKVTLVSGYIGTDDDLKDLGKKLKSKCGVGGSAKDGEVLIQGDHRDKVFGILGGMGFRVKKRGG